MKKIINDKLSFFPPPVKDNEKDLIKASFTVKVI